MHRVQLSTKEANDVIGRAKEVLRRPRLLLESKTGRQWKKYVSEANLRSKIDSLDVFANKEVNEKIKEVLLKELKNMSRAVSYVAEILWSQNDRKNHCFPNSLTQSSKTYKGKQPLDNFMVLYRIVMHLTGFKSEQKFESSPLFAVIHGIVAKSNRRKVQKQPIVAQSIESSSPEVYHPKKTNIVNKKLLTIGDQPALKTASSGVKKWLENGTSNGVSEKSQTTNEQKTTLEKTSKLNGTAYLKPKPKTTLKQTNGESNSEKEVIKPKKTSKTKRSKVPALNFREMSRKSREVPIVISDSEDESMETVDDKLFWTQEEADAIARRLERFMSSYPEDNMKGLPKEWMTPDIEQRINTLEVFDGPGSKFTNGMIIEMLSLREDSLHNFSCLLDNVSRVLWDVKTIKGQHPEKLVYRDKYIDLFQYILGYDDDLKAFEATKEYDCILKKLSNMCRA